MTERQLLPDLGDVWLDTLGWQPDEPQLQQFQQLYEEILSANRLVNLTRITAPKDFWEKHLWDSMAGILWWKLVRELGKRQPYKAIDIGTGAGFPGIPVAIANPNWTVTLLDSTGKKIAAIETFLTHLDLKNVNTLIGRAENIRQQHCHREAYDLALVRAVGTASVVAEYALPLLKIGGFAILYRGRWSDDDTSELSRTVARLGSKIESIEEFTTPLTQSIRHCVYLRKLSSTGV